MPDFLILFSEADSFLQLHLKTQDKTIDCGQIHLFDPVIKETSLNYWLLHAIRPLLEAFEPNQNIQIKVDIPHIEEKPLLKNGIAIFGKILATTYKLFCELTPLAKSTKDYHRTLFYSVTGSERFDDLYKNCQKNNPDSYCFEELDTGFDYKTRTFSNEPRYMNTKQLLQYIQKHQVQKIVAVNMYLMEYALLKEFVHLPTALKAIGVDYHVIDYDVYDHPADCYLKKACFHNDQTPHFSCMPHYQQPWDGVFNLKNMNYIPIYRGYEEQEFQPLEKDPELLILTHSRLSFIQNNFSQALYVLESFRPQHLMQDLYLWFYSVRHIILNEANYSLPQMLHCNAILDIFYNSCLHLFKCLFINEIKNDFKLKIFGDQGWHQIFPDLYQNKYLTVAEKKELFKKRNQLQILLNQNYSYLESNPVIEDAISRSTPFVCFPAFVKTNNLKAFSHIEYHTGQELKQKIQNINDIFKNQELKSTFSFYKQTMENGALNLENQLQGSKIVLKNNFIQECEAHHKLAQKRVLDNILNNRELLIEQMQHIFSGQKLPFSINESRYYQYDAVQAIISTL